MHQPVHPDGRRSWHRGVQLAKRRGDQLRSLQGLAAVVRRRWLVPSTLWRLALCRPAEESMQGSPQAGWARCWPDGVRLHMAQRPVLATHPSSSKSTLRLTTKALGITKACEQTLFCCCCHTTRSAPCNILLTANFLQAQSTLSQCNDNLRLLLYVASKRTNFGVSRLIES